MRRAVREASARDPKPSAASLDDQSVKTTEVGGVKRFDAGKKVKGHKRHILLDTLGLIIAVVVTSAGVQDYHGALPVLRAVKGQCLRLKVIWADRIYEKQFLIDWVKSKCGWELEVIKRSDKAKGFQVVPKRWVVERTFGWLGRYRRRSKDFEVLAETREAMIQLAMIHVMVRRLEPTSQYSLTSQKAGDLIPQAAIPSLIQFPYQTLSRYPSRSPGTVTMTLDLVAGRHYDEDAHEFFLKRAPDRRNSRRSPCPSC